MTEIDRVSGRSPTGSGRVEWLDVARGLGIILVVCGHVERGLVSAGIADGHWWAVLDRAIYSFHMPLFIMLAGMNVPSSLLKEKRNFLASKLETILHPYIVWSLIHGSILLAVSGFANTEIGFLDLLQIGWRPIAPFWFLYALFIFMTLASIFRSWPLLLWPAAALGLAYAQYDSSESLLHQVSYNLIFFAAGVTFSRRLYAVRLRWFVGPLIAVAWMLALQVIPSEGKAPYLKPVAVFAGFAGVFGVMFIAQKARGTVSRHFAVLGRLSMSIYVMHVIVASGLRIIAVNFAGVTSPMILMVVCTVGGIYVPVLAHAILVRLNLLPLLGLAKRRERSVSDEGRGRPSASAALAERR